MEENDFPKGAQSKRQIFANYILDSGAKSRLFDICSFLGQCLGQKTWVLCYHRVGNFNNLWSYPPLSPNIFEDHIKYISNNYKVITLNALADLLIENRPLPKKTLVLTFDDGYKDVYKWAYPILKKYDVPATVFLATGHIDSGRLFWWDKLGYIIFHTQKNSFRFENLGEFSFRSLEEKLKSKGFIAEKIKRIPGINIDIFLEEMAGELDVNIPTNIGRELILSWDEIIDMHQNGIDFGAHTVTHPILSNIDIDTANREISQSRTDIENKINGNVLSFCYPNGQPKDFNSQVINLLKEKGFKCAVTTIPRSISHEDGLYELGRITPEGSLSLLKFMTSGLYT